MYHGAHTRFALHIGLCLTDDASSASTYAANGQVATLDLDFSGLVVKEAAGYDRESDVAPGDDGATAAADVLVYDDEDAHGRCHRTWRIMSAKALAALRTVRVDDADWFAAGREAAGNNGAAWVDAWRTVTDWADDAAAAHDIGETPSTYVP